MERLGRTPEQILSLFVLLVIEGGEVARLLSIAGETMLEGTWGARDQSLAHRKAALLAAVRKRFARNGKVDLTTRSAMTTAGYGAFFDLSVLTDDSRDELVVAARQYAIDHADALRATVAESRPHFTAEQGRYFRALSRVADSRGGGVVFVSARAGRGKTYSSGRYKGLHLSGREPSICGCRSRTDHVSVPCCFGNVFFLKKPFKCAMGPGKAIYLYLGALRAQIFLQRAIYAGASRNRLRLPEETHYVCCYCTCSVPSVRGAV